MDTLQKPAP